MSDSTSFTTWGQDGSMNCKVGKGADGAVSCVAMVGGMADYQLAAQAGGPLAYISKTCPHCTSLAPTFGALASRLNSKLYAVDVNDAQCQAAGLCDDVQGVPKIVYLSSEGESDEYQGPRTVEALAAWAQQQQGAMMLGPNIVSAFSSMRA